MTKGTNVLERIVMEKNNLTHAIRKAMAIGASGLVLTSSTVWAEAYINPHEIPLSLSKRDKVCMVDLDRDGDLDIINYYDNIITKQENIGSLTTPLFAIEKVLASRYSDAFKIEKLNDNNLYCNRFFLGSADVDIDNDGDLDHFFGHYPRHHRYHKGLAALKFYENIGSELVDQNNDLGLPAGGMLFTDIDNDGDLDFFGRLEAPHYSTHLYEEDFHFYNNTGSPENPIFVKKDSPINMLCDAEERHYRSDIGAFSDINGDGQSDLVCKNNVIMLSSQEGYIRRKDVFQLQNDSDILLKFKINELDINQNKLSITYSDDTYSFKQASLNGKVITLGHYFNQDASKHSILEQCNIPIQDTESILIDFDGDNDLDLLATSGNTIENLTYCENKGGVESPLFSPHIPFDLFQKISDIPFPIREIRLADRDGDGDKDILVNGKFFDNIGTSKKPLFQHISHTPLSSGGYWLDLDNDGKIESTLVAINNGTATLFNKGKEVATSIDAVKINNDSLIIAINRPSQTQLYNCNPLSSSCSAPVVLPYAAKEISLSVGDFIGSPAGLIRRGPQEDEIALATIDSNGMINVEIYDSTLRLLSHGKGGSAHSIFIASGQLVDHDDESEEKDKEDGFVITFVQPDETVIAASVNFDMSIIGVVQLGKGKHPSVTVGHFANNENSYVLSYITLDDQLKIATIKSDGTLININDGGSASEAKISKATFMPDSPDDEYVISTRQSNGLAGLIGFSSNGEVLGQLTGGVAQQPTVISRYSSEGKSIGLAVSIIQADKKPAVIFLDNQGNVLATGVGGKKAVTATLVNSRSGSGNTTLVYVDEDGIPRWENFTVDGVKR